MPWLIPARRDAPELMDAPGLPATEVAEAYRVLRRINRQFFGSLRSLHAELRRSPEPRRDRTLTLLEVGSGSGDLLEAARLFFDERCGAASALALDRDPVALALAAKSPLLPVRADALRLPLADRSIDLVLAAKFAHHFSGPALGRLLAEMARVARGHVLVLDIRRHWLAYWGFVAWSRVFTRNRLVRFDGPLSVLRAFTTAELLALAAPLAAFRWEVRTYLGFQLALAGRRIESLDLLQSLAPAPPG